MSTRAPPNTPAWCSGVHSGRSPDSSGGAGLSYCVMPRRPGGPAPGRRPPLHAPVVRHTDNRLTLGFTKDVGAGRPLWPDSRYLRFAGGSPNTPTMSSCGAITANGLSYKLHPPLPAHSCRVMVLPRFNGHLG